MLARPCRSGLSGLALALVARVADAQPVAADLTVSESITGEGCPAPGWFEAQLRQRDRRGSVRVAIEPGADGFTGNLSAQGRGGEVIERRLTGPRCATVAEGLVLVAEVNLPGPPAPPAPPSSPPPAASAIPLRVALGASGSLDTVLADRAAWGVAASAWLTVGPGLLRGAGLSFGYSRTSVDAVVPLDLRRVGARLDLVPVALALGDDTALGLDLALSGGSLHAEADVSTRSAGSRSLWTLDLGPRLRRRVGPLWLDLDLAGSLALTRRRFTVTGLDAPVATLPRLGAVASLTVLVPLGR